jgi:hypothetical protein
MLEIFLIGVLLVICVAILVGVPYFIWNAVEQNRYWNDDQKMIFLPTQVNLNIELQSIISKYCPDTSRFNLLELGCGRAGVLRFLAKNYQWASAVGIEGQKTVWLQAKLIALLESLQYKIKPQILNQDFFQYEVKTPCLQYCYLGVKLMKALHEKGKFDNCIVVSLDYPIENIEPTETIILHSKSAKKIQKKLYVYDFIIPI